MLWLRNSVLLGPLSPHHSTVLTLKNSFDTFFTQFTILGIVVVLFFECMISLFALPRRSFKWILAAHTVAMFSLVTICNAANFRNQSFSYIDERQIPSLEYTLIYGPLYTYLTYQGAIDLIPAVTFVLNGWLADGLLVSPNSNSFTGYLT